MSIVDQILNSPTAIKDIEEARELLEAEQRMRAKFREDITEEHKWEFINGQVIMHSPAKNRHLIATNLLMKLVDTYVALNQLGQVRTEKALCGFSRNDYEPDIVFFSSEKAADFHPKTDIFPVPDFIVEVLSPSTSKRDRSVKMTDYAAHGVAEYWLVDCEAETVEQFLLEGPSYIPAEPQGHGEISSQVISGFTIPVRAIFEEKENLRALETIMAQNG